MFMKQLCYALLLYWINRLHRSKLSWRHTMANKKGSRGKSTIKPKLLMIPLGKASGAFKINL